MSATMAETKDTLILQDKRKKGFLFAMGMEVKENFANRSSTVSRLPEGSRLTIDINSQQNC
jgi:hypothetical protein